ncbi:MAG: glycosyltransferase family 2 protein [Candidatus Thermofonsia bacterium]|nr:MAG: glycosyltransferase family 2 protein [Candidatus Thermofonsia bacterium]
MNQPDLSIIIVSWNVRELLRQCLLSIRQNQGGLQVEIIVVDGASADGSAEMVREAFPDVVLIACQENVGFPRGNNLGIAAANGRYLLILNPDTEIVGDALPQMVAYMQAHPEVGVLGPQLLYPDGTIQSSRRRFPTLTTAFFESTWLQPYAPKAVLDHYYAADLPDDELAEVDWVMGAAMMLPADVVTAVGGMDPGYFMYSEELDWCRRIKAAGWRVIYFPQAKIIHHEGKSSEQAIAARHINFNRAKLRYYRKYHGRLAALLLRAFLLKSYVYQIVVEGVKGLLGHKRPLRWQRIKVYWQVIRTGLPPAGQ